VADSYLLGYRVLNSLDFAEEFMWSVIIERKLSIQHCVQEHTKSPHVTRLAVVQPTCNSVIIVIGYLNLFKYSCFIKNTIHILHLYSWLGDSVVERRSLIGEISLVCTRPAADG